ncbi:MAG: hypothetical protein FJ298_07400 [Planctomycetes bacterium]|nr:hypothetical protein [Planctomycetota bacterium]
MRILPSAAALLLLLVPAVAQRGPGRASPFSDFHKQAELAAGQPAPRLLAEDTQGRTVDLRDYLGQWVFIEFGSYT